MKKNIGSTDRVLRVMIALIFAAIFFTGLLPGLAGLILLAVATILVFTSTISICPLYYPFNLDTTDKVRTKA